MKIKLAVSKVVGAVFVLKTNRFDNYFLLTELEDYERPHTYRAVYRSSVWDSYWHGLSVKSANYEKC